MVKRVIKPAARQIELFDCRRRVKVLIVEDHALMREGLRLMISHESNLEVCGVAASQPEAQQLINRLHPDMVVVDLTLQEGDGLDLIHWIKRQKPDTKVIVSTMHDERVYGERVLRAGADGYVNKQDPAATVIRAIGQVLDGRLHFGQELINRILSQTATRPEHHNKSLIDSLSNREFDVFRLLGEGKTVEEIAHKLHLTRSTVDTYRERLKTKLSLKSSEELVYRAIHWVCENP